MDSREKNPITRLLNPLNFYHRVRQGRLLCGYFPNFGYREERAAGHYMEPLILVIAAYILVESSIFWQVAVGVAVVVSVFKRFFLYNRIRDMFSDQEMNDLVVVMEMKLKHMQPAFVEEAMDEIAEQCDNRYAKHMARRRQKEKFNSPGQE